MSREQTFELGVVELQVKNLEVMTTFYHDVVGLELISEQTSSATLGSGRHVLLALHQDRDLSPAHPTHAGLYHFAILFSSRGDLARTIHRILTRTPHLFTGSADHLVSEAFYFNDPEGNGIELYFDRHRSTWKWENGQVKMASLYIDPVQYIESYLPLEEKESTTSIGHVHLKVGEIEKAKAFYVDILGFDITARLPEALFISVDGYHHHIGLNTWESKGSGERESSLGLKSFSFVFPDSKAFSVLRERLIQNKVPFVEQNAELIFHDPWKNQIVARTG
jgi:catechol 2,3-dioxygenase